MGSRPTARIRYAKCRRGRRSKYRAARFSNREPVFARRTGSAHWASRSPRAITYDLTISRGIEGNLAEYSDRQRGLVMIPRHASVFICDEILISLTGKYNILGNYTGDIAIPSEPAPAAQLVFLFVIETDVKDLYQSLALQVTLPGSPPIKQAIPVIPQIPLLPDRPRWSMRWPLLIPQPLLRPGRIEAKVIHESGELTAGTPWIVLAPQPALPIH